MSDPRPLHRLFGLSWIDFFQGSAVTVETEIDLSLKKQFPDLVIIRKGPEPIARPLPDGFNDLADHNLLTFKSHQETLDGWSFYELIGHYVNYRKQFSPSMQNLWPASEFRLLAVCARYPHNLAQEVTLTPVQEGVYEVRLLTMNVRVIVVNQLPCAEYNAMLHLFAARGIAELWPGTLSPALGGDEYVVVRVVQGIQRGSDRARQTERICTSEHRPTPSELACGRTS